jgi:hypothetical protein
MTHRALPSVLVSLVLLACAPGAEQEAGDSPPILEATIDLSIGSAEGSGADVFGRVGGVLGMPDGRILVSDLQANEIRVFDADGHHLFTFGREGEGPGDLGGPCCLALGPDGTVWVREAMNGRYSAFEVGADGAQFIRTVRQRHGAMGLMAPLTFDAEGRLVDVGERVSPNGDGSERVRYHLDSDGEIASTDVVVPASLTTLGSHLVQRETADGPAVFYLWQPFGSRAVSAHGPRGRWALAVTGEYEVMTWHGLAVDTLVGGVGTGPPLTADELQAGQAAMERDADRVGVRVADFPFGLPENRTPISQLYYDDLGRLWVELSASRGDARAAEVWNDDGILEARVTWPASVSLGTVSWIGDGVALGVARDELGVESVVRLRY